MWRQRCLQPAKKDQCLRRLFPVRQSFKKREGWLTGSTGPALGRRPLYAEFVPDAGIVGMGVIVGEKDWERRLAANKQSFIETWITRPAFRSRYDALGNDAFVEALISNTGVALGELERLALVNGLNAGTITQASALGELVENQAFVAAKRNEAFEMMEYFGYLRRDPDESGYQFWLNKLNQFGGNFEQAEMVKAFITSGEYRQRFPR